jgi:hypothetical protein
MWATAWVVVLLTTVAFRIQLASRHPCCQTGDTPVYVRLAENILDHRVYSLDRTAPHGATSIRMPGYPMFLAAAYTLRRSDDFIRIMQALIDTATCVLVAVLAFQWVPTERGRATALAALVLMAICPVTAIFVAVLYPETLFTFFVVATALVATLAIKARRYRAGMVFATGLLSGVATLVRPEGALLGAGLGAILTLTARGWARRLTGALALAHGAAFCLGFAVGVAPWTTWTLLNSQRLLPSPHTVLPDGIVPRGYYMWLRTWVKNDTPIDSLIWRLPYRPITMGEIPDYAFDSPDEKVRVASLLDRHSQSAYDASRRAAPFSATMTAAGMARLIAPGLVSGDGELVMWTMRSADDAEFERIALERIKRDPLRHYLWLPIKRGSAMWFDYQFDYYNLGRWPGLWRRVFRTFVIACTILALIGAYLLVRVRPTGLRWVVLVAILAVPRMILVSMLENPEPRYMVPLFPLAMALGGVAVASLGSWWRPVRS